MSDTSLSWREAVKKFLYSCCYGEKKGIMVMTVEEQQIIFRRLSEESCKTFRENQFKLFGKILECFGVRADKDVIHIFTNLSLTAIIICRAIPDTLPFFVPEAAEKTIDFQINAIVDCLEKYRI